jgi:Family of unknown function (DUF6130)
MDEARNHVLAGHPGKEADVKAHAKTARDVRGPSPLVALDHEGLPKLIVDPPLVEPLKERRVFIQYRTENLRVLPVFGAGALDVSPRIGHVHITVDDAPWHFIDASGETVVVVWPCSRPASDPVRIGGPDPPSDRQSDGTVHYTGVRSQGAGRSFHHP